MSDSETSRRRPWLAAALALAVSGLGHAYLRRWARAFGWYAVITATLVFVVPDAAVDGILGGTRPPVVDIAPALVAVAASVVDAYVLAVRNNRAHERSLSSATETAAQASQPSDDRGETRSDPVETAETTSGSDVETGSSESVDGSVADRVSCPHCGRETDAALDFCQWCAEPLEE
ncbi:DUF7575 domain-containing protein [Halorubrum sp. N11]|uniref:DUF7575 domain-containing protein n=1 Tax=Halorubrum sp. N11 TaxID=3402276 RepID=UPI003EBF23F9